MQSLPLSQSQHEVSPALLETCRTQCAAFKYVSELQPGFHVGNSRSVSVCRETHRAVAAAQNKNVTGKEGKESVFRIK